MPEQKWWERPQRYIQYNMQVQDADKIDAQRLALQTQQLGATAAVVNAAGVYSWYPSQIPFHKMYSAMEGKRDYFGEMVEAFHAKGIHIIARFSFGFIEDVVYGHAPHWAMRGPDKKAHIIGAERPGEWSLLYTACQNGPYLQELCLPVFEEVLQRYPIDGVFFNGGGGYPCWCNACQQEYQERYGKPMPADPAALEPSWAAYKKEKIAKQFYDCVKRVAPSVAIIGSYQPFAHHSGVSSFSIPCSDLKKDLQYSDLVSTETQDSLSSGCSKLPQWNFPAIKSKMGAFDPQTVSPIVIVHTCPGLDWRHTGIPSAEYLYWASQVPANSGQLWLSLTGIPDTITDRRILDTVQKLFDMTAKIQRDMVFAKSSAPILLVTNGTDDAQAWSSILSSLGFSYDMAAPQYLESAVLSRYRVAIFPNGFHYTSNMACYIEEYVSKGGRVIIEGHSPRLLSEVKHLLGAETLLEESETLEAAYVRLETEFFKEATGSTELIPLKGKVCYCHALSNACVHATFVPPFAPKQVTGAPPERASLLVSHTDFPLCIESAYQKGKVVYLPFSIGALAAETGLQDFESFLNACISLLLEKRFRLRLSELGPIMVSTFEQDNQQLIHLINAIGARPLKRVITCHNFVIQKDWDEKNPPKSVVGKISGQALPWKLEDNTLIITVPRLETWEMICISK